ncbi:MAG: hypothetical protein ABJA77_02795, partial [Variovorax sp.]
MDIAPTRRLPGLRHAVRMFRWMLPTMSVVRSAPDRFGVYRPTLSTLPLTSVPLAHALVHAVAGIDDALRRWLDTHLAARAPTALGQPASRAAVAVWHALQDARATGLPVAADADWALLCAIGRQEAAVEAMRFVLRIHAVTVEWGLPGADEAARALASPITQPGSPDGVTPATTRS